MRQRPRPTTTDPVIVAERIIDAMAEPFALAKLQARVRVHPNEVLQPTPAIEQRLAAQIPAVEGQYVEGEQHQALGRASMAYRSALKSVTPAAFCTHPSSAKLIMVASLTISYLTLLGLPQQLGRQGLFDEVGRKVWASRTKAEPATSKKVPEPESKNRGSLRLPASSGALTPSSPLYTHKSALAVVIRHPGRRTHPSVEEALRAAST